MSPWVRDAQSALVSGQSSGDQSLQSNGSLGPEPKRKAPWWIRSVPFFLSAFLFLSGFFSVFAPLPLLFLSMQSKRGWLWMAALTNGAIVALGGGWASFGFYAVFVLSLVLALSECLKHKRSVELSVGATLAAMAITAFGILSFYAHRNHISPWSETQILINQTLDYVFNSLPQDTRNSLTGGSGDPEEWRKGFFLELPSAVLVFSLLLVWINLTVLIRLNVGRIREFLGLDFKFLQTWKAPEWLVWPTILAGFFLLIDLGLPTDIALNVFKFLMAIYAIQGLSVLSFFFDVWHIRGIFRSLAYVLAVFLMLPLVLSIGFFDLWFDFRAKLRQS